MTNGLDLVVFSFIVTVGESVASLKLVPNQRSVVQIFAPHTEVVVDALLLVVINQRSRQQVFASNMVEGKNAPILNAKRWPGDGLIFALL